jgi:hypothetical protein
LPGREARWALFLDVGAPLKNPSIVPEYRHGPGVRRARPGPLEILAHATRCVAVGSSPETHWLNDCISEV